mmetsp:Transcript_10302/g.20606  ORF Transcript_10302/g.20606 Transcript_10302/m.20606 type:complete len:193 (-) Transcript_10302:2080-2658(-)
MNCTLFSEERKNEKKTIAFSFPRDEFSKTIGEVYNREYNYEELLDRLFENLNKNGLDSEKNERLTIQPPKIGREGTKKTVYLNFTDTCMKLNREKEHLLLYISTELGAFASIQNGGGLVLKGRYQPKGMENVLKNYINEYVLCGSCGSAKTFLKKDSITRLSFLLCHRCKASRSVNPIRQGYVAQIKRKKNY